MDNKKIKLLFNGVSSIIVSIAAGFISVYGINIASSVYKFDYIVKSNFQELFLILITSAVMILNIYYLFNYLSNRKNQIKAELDSNPIKPSLPKKQKQKTAELDDLSYFYPDVRNRLETEIKDLGTKSYLNLGIGLGFSGIAIIVLGYPVFFSTISDGIQLLNMIPRVIFSGFSAFLAYFFLGLYRRNMEEIKYYQNELTNSDYKFMAFHHLINSGDKKEIAAGIMELLRTERNFILNKNQTTEDLEKMKHGYNNINQLTDNLSQIIKSIRNGV